MNEAQTAVQIVAPLVALLIVALFAAGLTDMLRAVPPIKSLVFRGVRPWACDLCMSWWGACIGVLIARYLGIFGQGTQPVMLVVHTLFVAVVAVPMSMFVLRILGKPTGDAFEPPSGDV